MKHNLNQTVAGTFAFLGVLCITSGALMPSMANDKTADVTNKITKLNVTQKRVAKLITNEIIVKDIELEINGSLSTNVKDYLKNPTNIEDSIVKKLKLDTSNVSVTSAGKYTYTIAYGKKVYTGNVVVKDKNDDKKIESLTLNTLEYEVGKELSKDITTYVKETLTDEVKSKLKLDLSKVDTTKPGNYQYSISWDGKLFTNNITIYEPKYGTNTVVIENAKTTNITVENKKGQTNTQETTPNTENNTQETPNNEDTQPQENTDSQTNENP